MYELPFSLLLDTMIANTEFESDGSGTNSPGIANGEALVEWWEGRPESEFREAVLFRILTPTSSGAVERFFSMTGTVTAAQNALSDNIRRMRFMAQFNGDIEDCLV